jgi:hypothetical protein
MSWHERRPVIDRAKFENHLTQAGIVWSGLDRPEQGRVDRRWHELYGSFWSSRAKTGVQADMRGHSSCVPSGPTPKKAQECPGNRNRSGVSRCKTRAKT